MESKKSVSLSLLIVGVILFFELSAQITNPKEVLLVHQWQLVAYPICDRCPDRIPTEILLVDFKSDYSCSGALVGTAIITNAKWELLDNKLTIIYEQKSGNKKQKTYTIGELNNNSLILWQDTYGGTSRKFKVFN